MRTQRTLRFIVGLTALALACGTVTHSSYLEVGGLWVVYAVVRQADGTLEAVGHFRERSSSGEALTLDNGDVLTVDDAGTSQVNGATIPGFGTSAVAVAYTAAVVDAGTHRFVFTRTGADPVEREVADPPAFAPVFSDGGTSWAGSPGAVTLTWTAVSGATITLTATVGTSDACRGGTLAEGLSDTGTVTLTSALFPTDGGTCTMALQFQQVKDTDIGSPFHGGALRQVSVARATVAIQ